MTLEAEIEQKQRNAKTLQPNWTEALHLIVWMLWKDYSEYSLLQVWVRQGVQSQIDQCQSNFT